MPDIQRQPVAGQPQTFSMAQVFGQTPPSVQQQPPQTFSMAQVFGTPASSHIPPPPAGFVMDAPQAAQAAPQIPPPPQGFVMDNAQAPPIPDGYQLVPPQQPPTQMPAIPQGYQLVGQSAPAQPQQPAPAPHMTKEQYLNSLPWYERLPAEFVGNQTLGHAAEAVAGNQVSGQALKTVAQPIQGLMGLASPQAGQIAQQQINSAYGESHGAGGFVGQQIGNVVNLPYMLSGAGRALSAAAAAGNERIDVANQRDAGKQISGSEELAKAAGMGALDWGANKLMNDYGGKLFGQLNPAAATTTKALLRAYAAKFGKDAVTNEAVSHAMIGVNNLIAGRPFTEGMGASSIAGALVQTAGQLGLHEVGQAAEGKPNFLSEMRRRAAGTANEANADVQAHANVGQNGQEQNQQQPGQIVGGHVPSFPRTLDNGQRGEPQQRGPNGQGEQAGPSVLNEGVKRLQNPEQMSSGGPVHTPEFRPETEPTWDHSKNLIPPPQEGPRIPASEFKMPPREPQASDEAFKIQAKDKAGFNLPGSEEGNAFPQQKSAVAPRHPDSLADADAVAQHYAANNGGDEQGGQVVASMMGMKTAPGEKFVKALVPSDKINPLNLTEDSRDPNKIATIQNLPSQDRANLPPVYVNKDMVSPDGGHRVTAAQNLGEPVTAYVPESLIGQHGITAAPAEQANETGRSLLRDLRTKAAEQATPEAAQQVQGTTKPSNDFLARMKAKGAARIAELATNESGGAAMTASRKFAERDVAPAIAQAGRNLKTSWDVVNRFVGTGAGWSEKERDTANNLRTVLGEHEVNQARTETAMKPYRDLLNQQTEKQNVEWVSQVEATGTAPDKATQPLADLNRKLNEANIERAKKLGMDDVINDPNWIGRVFDLSGLVDEEPDGHGGTRYSLAGMQHFLKGREFGTMQDAYNFVTSKGGKLRYPNAADMMLAKQGEVSRSLDAREAMYHEEDRGQLKWAPDNERKPEGYDNQLNDPVARQARPVIAPKWMVAKLAKMEHFDAQRYMQSPEWKKYTQILRPGDDMPEGMAQTGQKVAGRFAANDNVANIFNSLINPGLNKSLPVLKQIAATRRAMTAANLFLPTVHATLESGINAMMGVGNAMENAMHGQWGLFGKNVWRAINPVAANRFGQSIRDQAANPAAHPELEPIVQAVQRGGNQFNLESVLNKDNFEKARTEWAEGNKIGAGARLLRGVYDKISGPLFDEYIPNLKAAYKAAAAESALQRGLSGAELDRHMARVQDNADNVIGMVKRDFQFQNKIMTDLEDVIGTAPKFAEGTLRHVGATGRDLFKAVRDIGEGKQPTVTPAMYTAAAGMLTTAISSALIQAAYTLGTTGKIQWPTSLMDYIKPRTGRTDAQGREQRISVLSPFSLLFSLAQSPDRAIGSRVASLWRAIGEDYSNADYRNRQIYNPNDSAPSKAWAMLKHVGKEARPFALQNLLEQHEQGRKVTYDEAVGESLGMHYTYTPKTDAEKAAWDAIYSHERVAPKTQEEGAKSDLLRRLGAEMKGKDSRTWKDIRQAVAEGKIAPQDVSRIHQRATEKPGLQGLLGQSSLTATDIMERVWPKMSPDEMRANQWIVRGRVGRSAALTAAQRRAYFDQIGRDVRASVSQ